MHACNAGSHSAVSQSACHLKPGSSIQHGSHALTAAALPALIPQRSSSPGPDRLWELALQRNQPLQTLLSLL